MYFTRPTLILINADLHHNRDSLRKLQIATEESLGQVQALRRPPPISLISNPRLRHSDRRSRCTLRNISAVMEVPWRNTPRS